MDLDSDPNFLSLIITVPTLGMDLQFTLNSFTETKGMESYLNPNLNQWKNPAIVQYIVQ